MTISKKTYDAFASEYKNETEEILVLLSNPSGGAGKTSDDAWSANAYFLAYHDIQTGKLKKGEGRLVWLISDEDLKQHGLSYPYFFKQGTIYKLRVRDLIDRTVPQGGMRSFYNRFLIVDVLEENAESSALKCIQEKYWKPVVLNDDLLGLFTLNKDLSLFEAYITWLGEEISVLMEVDIMKTTDFLVAINQLMIQLNYSQETVNH